MQQHPYQRSVNAGYSTSGDISLDEGNMAFACQVSKSFRASSCDQPHTGTGFTTCRQLSNPLLLKVVNTMRSLPREFIEEINVLRLFAVRPFWPLFLYSINSPITAMMLSFGPHDLLARLLTARRFVFCGLSRCLNAYYHIYNLCQELFSHRLKIFKTLLDTRCVNLYNDSHDKTRIL